MGRKLGSEIGPGTTISLTGELGAGKTTFIQGLAEGLGVKGRINSPTFIIMREYPGKPEFIHADLYRLEGDVGKEVENLGLMDVIKEGNAVVVIEWAEKMKDLLPKDTINIKFDIIDEKSRKIIIEK